MTVHTMLIGLLTGITIFSIIYLGYISVIHPWRFYLKTTEKWCVICSRGNYRKFVDEFTNNKLQCGTVHMTSFFATDKNGLVISEVHSHIIMFNKVGMLLSLFDYLRVKRFIKQKGGRF